MKGVIKNEQSRAQRQSNESSRMNNPEKQVPFDTRLQIDDKQSKHKTKWMRNTDRIKKKPGVNLSVREDTRRFTHIVKSYI